MALEEAAREPLSTWFLIARSGNLLLRLHHELRLGEDDAGEVVLAAEPDAALLRITRHQGGLQLHSDRDGWLLHDELADLPGDGAAEVLVRPGNTVRLALPHNVFTLSSDSTRYGRITKRITLIAEPEIPTLDNPLAPTEQDPVVQDTALSADVEDLLADIIIAEPEQRDDLEATAADDLMFELVTESPAATEVAQTAADVVEAQRRGNSAALAALVLFLVSALFLTANQQHARPAALAANSAAVISPATAASAPDIELIRASASRLIDVDANAMINIDNPEPEAVNRSYGDSPASADNATAITAPASSEPQISEPAAASPDAAGSDNYSNAPSEHRNAPLPVSEVSVDAPATALLQSQLDEAARLMAAGRLVDPQRDNAVKILISVLRADPGNEQALTMIYECAMQLLDQARAAERAGDDFLARNLTEEVLAFHPTLPEALALKSRLWAR